MKKKFVKFLSAALAAVMCFSLAACGDIGEKIDPNRTQLYVYNYNGGYGTEWLTNAKTKYETLHPEVQIVIDPQKPANGNLGKNDITTGKNQVFFNEGQDYYPLIAENALGDITEALTSVNPYDNKKIIDKFSDEQKSYFGVGDKYYGVPHYSGYIGLVYNIDLFDENGWYIAEGYDTTVSAKTEDMFVANADDPRSKGPDGEEGTDDDGLPATYEQFQKLCDYIASTSNVYPLTWTGQYREQYVGFTYQSLVADFEGKDAFMLNYTFTGTATDLGKIENGNFVKDSAPTVIGSSNGYELARQEGKYRALDFMNDLFDDDRYYDITLATNGSDSNTGAMQRLIEGDAAMLMEGAWWENEADDANMYDGDKYDCNMGWMPLPKANADKVGEKNTLIDHLNSFCFIRADLTDEQKALAYDFIQFVYSDEMLVEFTKTTGTLKALNYEVKDSDLSGLTTYAKSLVKYASNADVAYAYSNNSIFYNNKSSFDARYAYHSNYDGTYKDGLNNPVYMLLSIRIDKKKTPSVEAYFTGMYEYAKTDAKFKG